MNTHEFALQVEQLLCFHFGFKSRPCGTVFDADAIERGFFYDAMCLLLCKKDVQGWTDFADKYLEYQNKNINQISNIDLIFNEFKKLLNK